MVVVNTLTKRNGRLCMHAAYSKHYSAPRTLVPPACSPPSTGDLKWHSHRFCSLLTHWQVCGITATGIREAGLKGHRLLKRLTVAVAFTVCDVCEGCLGLESGHRGCHTQPGRFVAVTHCFVQQTHVTGRCSMRSCVGAPLTQGFDHRAPSVAAYLLPQHDSCTRAARFRGLK